jgi:anti-anti-sigma factor
MDITARTQGNVTILTLSGRFTFSAGKKFQTAIQKAVEKGLLHIVVNLQEVPYMDSAAIGTLMVVRSKLKKAGVKLTLANPQDWVQKVLDFFRFPTQPSVEEALSSTTATPRPVGSMNFR